MKEFPIRLTSFRDLIRFQAYVYSNHLHGEIRQKRFVCSIRFGLYLALALPLEEATLYLKDCPQASETELAQICHTAV